MPKGADLTFSFGVSWHSDIKALMYECIPASRPADTVVHGRARHIPCCIPLSGRNNKCYMIHVNTPLTKAYPEIRGGQDPAQVAGAGLGVARGVEGGCGGKGVD